MNVEITETQEPKSTTSLTIKVPGSVANLGPGIGAVALATQLYLNVTVELQAPHKSGEPEIIADPGLDSAVSGLLVKTMRKLWPQDPLILSCLKIVIDSDIPVDCGLGASSAAILAGTTAVMALTGMPLHKGGIFAQAADLEGAANTVGASLFGGFSLCGQLNNSQDILARKIEWPQQWCLLAAIPPRTVPAKKAKAALPTSVSHRDAISNLQKVALLIEAVAATDTESMKVALRDRINEPALVKFAPELAEVRKLLQEQEILGTFLSGGGPSIITVVDSANKSDVLQVLNDWSRDHKSHCRILEIPVDHEGLVVNCG